MIYHSLMKKGPCAVHMKFHGIKLGGGPAFQLSLLSTQSDANSA